jgi:hypothetical protein
VFKEELIDSEHSQNCNNYYKTNTMKTKTIEITSSMDDLTISQFEKLIEIDNKNYDNSIDANIDLLSVISNFTKEEIEEMDINEFKKVINIVEKIDYKNFSKKFINEFEVDGVKFKTKATKKEFNFSVKEVMLLKNLVINKESNYLSELIAILFRNVDDNGELINDLSTEAIQERKEKIGDIKMKIVGPYLVALTEFFLKQK